MTSYPSCGIYPADIFVVVFSLFFLNNCAEVNLVCGGQQQHVFPETLCYSFTLD